MVDTIILLIPQHMFQIMEPERFSPSAQWALQRLIKASYLSKQNPTKKELLRGIYKPRLTLASRPNRFGVHEILLKVELSLPKLIFGNNFSELQYKDMQEVIRKLALILHEMGVSIEQDALTQAPVSVIHYAKNIPLTDGSTPYHYIKKIKEANVKLFMDVNKTDYRNEGHSYRWHCNSYEIVFYDKIKELEKGMLSSKRALEKDHELQVDLLNALQKRTKKFEVLRMEVRLNKRRKIKHLLSKLGITNDLTFKKLCKPSIAKKILLHYMDELESRRPPLLSYKPASDKALLVELMLNNPELSVNRIIQAYGLKKIMDDMGLRELRVLFARYKERSWYRLMGGMNKLKLSNVQSPISKMREEIERFKAMKMPRL